MAEVCEACHIKFIGPSANVIRLLGDKARARRVMKKAGVPVLPGSDGPVDSEERGLKVAKDMGYPVIIKAAAGGGGRGMRIVRDARRARAGPAHGAARGAGGLRRRRRLHREVHRGAAPHRVPDPRRSPRRRRPPRRARVLDSAPAPEADRGSAVGGADREDAPQAREHRRRRREGGAVHQRRHVRVPDGRRPATSSSSRPTRACRSSTASPSSSPASTSSRSRLRLPPGSGCSFRQGDVDVPRPRHRVPHQRRAPRDVRAEPRPDPGVLHARRSRRARRHVRALRVHDLAVLRFAGRQDHGARPRSHRSDRAHAPHARDDGGRRHPHHHPAAPEGAGRARLPGRPHQHVVHGALPAEAKKQPADERPRPSRARLAEAV